MSTTKPDVSDAEANGDPDSLLPQQKLPAAAKPVGVAPKDTAASFPANRRLWRALLAFILIAAAAGLFAWYRAAQRTGEESHLVLAGNIDVRQVNLAFKREGRIATLDVDEGDAAGAGQVIATLDKRYFEDDLRLAQARRNNVAANLARLEHGSRREEIAEARASVAQQRAVRDRARKDFDRAASLVGKGAVSQENFDQAKAALDEAEATVKYAEQALQLTEIGPRQEDIDAARAQLAGEDAAVIQAERRLGDADLIAPSAGIILTRVRERGAIVAAGEPVFTLTLSTPVWVRTYVNERDLGRIQPGMPGVVRTDSAADKVYRGRIGFISPTAEFTPKTVETRELRTDLVYRLRVLVDNPDGGLRQGMPVTVTLELDGQGQDKPGANRREARAAQSPGN